MFITSKNKYLSNDMKIFGTCSIPLTSIDYRNISLSTITRMLQHTGKEVFDHSSQLRISRTI